MELNAPVPLRSVSGRREGEREAEPQRGGGGGAPGGCRLPPAGCRGGSRPARGALWHSAAAAPSSGAFAASDCAGLGVSHQKLKYFASQF